MIYVKKFVARAVKLDTKNNMADSVSDPPPGGGNQEAPSIVRLDEHSSFREGKRVVENFAHSEAFNDENVNFLSVGGNNGSSHPLDGTNESLATEPDQKTITSNEFDSVRSYNIDGDDFIEEVSLKNVQNVHSPSHPHTHSRLMGPLSSGGRAPSEEGEHPAHGPTRSSLQTGRLGAQVSPPHDPSTKEGRPSGSPPVSQWAQPGSGPILGKVRRGKPNACAPAGWEEGEAGSDHGCMSEDEDVPESAPLGVSEGFQKALECKFKAPSGIIWGCVIGMYRNKARIAYGDNKSLTLKAPNSGRYKNLKVGMSVAVGCRTKIFPDGSTTLTYWLRDTAAEEVWPDRLPSLNARVISFNGDVGEGTAIVPMLGVSSTFCLVGEQGPVPLGSSFSFLPEFNEEGVIRIPPIKVGSIALPARVCANRVTQLGALEPTRADLAHGHYCPSKGLQRDIVEHFGVNSSPFFSEAVSELKYAGGRNFLAALANHYSGSRQSNALVPSHMQVIEEVMVKKSIFDELSSPSNEDIREALSGPIVHLAIPTTSHLPTFTSWLKSNLKEAGSSGGTLRLILGVFIDAECTPGGLYNTEECPFFKQKSFPWVRSFTIVEGPAVMYQIDSHGRMTPALAPLRGKKLMLIDFDSRFDCRDTLPSPNVMETTVNGGHVWDEICLYEEDDRVEVLVSLPKGDTRRDIFLGEFEGSVFRRTGKLEILAIPMTEEVADDFVETVAEEPGGLYAMRKEDLYEEGTLTLSCEKGAQVSPGELYQLLGAAAVLPIGHDRYRFVTNRDMLDVARVLYKQNMYKKEDNKKFRTLRSDRDRFVHLTHKMPKKLDRYYRRIVPMEGEPTTVPERKFWHQIANLPRGLEDRMLDRAIRNFEWWPCDDEVEELLIDRRSYYPTIWVATASDVVFPDLCFLNERPVVLLASESPPPGCVSLGSDQDVSGEEIDVKALVRRQAEKGDRWQASKATQSFLKTYYRGGPSGERKALRSSRASGRENGRGRVRGLEFKAEDPLLAVEHMAVMPADDLPSFSDGKGHASVTHLGGSQPEDSPDGVPLAPGAEGLPEPEVGQSSMGVSHNEMDTDEDVGRLRPKRGRPSASTSPQTPSGGGACPASSPNKKKPRPSLRSVPRVRTGRMDQPRLHPSLKLPDSDETAAKRAFISRLPSV